MIVINIVVISPLSAANLIQSAELNTGNTTHKAYKEEIARNGDVRRQAGMLASMKHDWRMVAESGDEV